MAEKEYIELEAAIAKIKDKINEYPYNSNPYWISNDDYIVRGLREAIEIIDEYTPTADVQEVRHGKWETIIDAYGHIEGWLHKECGRQVTSKDEYCPHCGAKMDKE